MKSVCQPGQPFNCPKFHFHRWFNMVKVVKYILDVDVEQQVDGSLVPDLLRFKSVALFTARFYQTQNSKASKLEAQLFLVWMKKDVVSCNFYRPQN